MTSSKLTICSLFSLQYLDTFDLSPNFSEEEFRHWFIPRNGIVDSYVVEVSIIHCFLFMLEVV